LSLSLLLALKAFLCPWICQDRAIASLPTSSGHHGRPDNTSMIECLADWFPGVERRAVNFFQNRNTTATSLGDVLLSSSTNGFGLPLLLSFSLSSRMSSLRFSSIESSLSSASILLPRLVCRCNSSLFLALVWELLSPVLSIPRIRSMASFNLPACSIKLSLDHGRGYRDVRKKQFHHRLPLFGLPRPELGTYR
jgi:hypothetical protein